MRVLGILAMAVALASFPGPASAGLGRKCRKVCKPAVAECVATTGKSRRACRKLLIPLCKSEGLEVCSGTTTTTSPTTGTDESTTTTTLPSGGGGTGGGAMSLNVEELSVEGSEDPLLYTLTITIGYSVVTANAVKQVGLDPASFTVLDEDTGAIYPAEPAAAAGDCSADDVIALGGPKVTCTVRFLMPSSVGEPSLSGGVHAKLKFETLGLRGSDYWSAR